MAKVLVLYYSAYGHIETMAYAAAEGAKSAGADVTVKRVPELVPESVAKASYFKMDQKAEIATPAELDQYDAIIVGAGTRFGTVASQMRNFWDQTGGLWAQGKLVGKVGSIFTSSATQHGGENRPSSAIPTLMHHGMVVVGALRLCGPVWRRSGQGRLALRRLDYHRRRRLASAFEVELEAARYQGAHVAKIAPSSPGHDQETIVLCGVIEGRGNLRPSILRGADIAVTTGEKISE
jgi:NAD(P)H dehydrogenase (quinone)